MATKRLSFVLASVAFSLAIPLVVSAQGPGASPQAAMRGDRLGMFRAAGIDKAQEQKLFDLTKEFEGKIIPMHQSLIALLKEMQGYSLQPDPDQNKVVATQEAINKVNGEISVERIKFHLKMRSVLTPEQKQKFLQLMKQSSAGPEGAPAGEPTK